MSIDNRVPPARLPEAPATQNPVTVCGNHLTIDEVVRVARHGGKARLTDDEVVLQRIRASCDYIVQAVEAEEPIYGVTSGFGGMADITISREEATELQNNLLWFLNSGAGTYLPARHVRAAMLLRANALMSGISGIRLEIIQRFITFLNAGVTPKVRSLGSIGASGDLVPLAAIGGAVTGLDACFKVDFDGEETDALSALERLKLPRLRLAPKEGLAIVNGTSVMTGIAANCVDDAQTLLAVSFAAHALMMQGLGATNQTFHPFIHRHKAHPGQLWSAAQMLELLSGSQLVRDELDGCRQHVHDELVQDRYSLRCHPQYMGPIVDGLRQIVRQTTTEINSVTDNPLIDAETQTSYHCGNFLGQYIGTGMDQLRHHIGLLAKHLDVQIALMVSPEFNGGLSASLVGQTGRKVNMGLKGLQITGNSIMPLLTFLGAPLVHHYPTHAEQFNQNINSQGFGSAVLACQSIELFQQYLAVALLFGVQGVDLRTHAKSGHYDARECLSAATVPLYDAVHELLGRSPSRTRPYIWNDNEQDLSSHIAIIAADLAADESRIALSVKNTVEALKHEYR
ncbi:HAL/PAL/TAL family ammonia-lyase [Endothiovibrio diazotrophicus]